MHLCITAWYKYFKHKAPQMFFHKNFTGLNPQKFSPADPSNFMVINCYETDFCTDESLYWYIASPLEVY